MFEKQTTETKFDEFNRCHDRSWLSTADEKRFGVTNPVDKGANPQLPYEGLIHIGHKVTVEGEQLIGLTTKIFLSAGGQISHLAVRTARLFGRHKMVPIESVSDISPLRVLLSISHSQFQQLPEYRSDSDIAEEVDRALWGDVVLRSTDYPEIDTQVRDGVITMNGHVTTGMNQWRAETAVNTIPGILGMKSYLIRDDKLALLVAEAVGQIDPGGIGNISTKVENGLVVLIGEVSSTVLRDQVERRISEIPWVRGIINELSVPGTTLHMEDARFLQPLIGSELNFLDAVSVTARKVIINPLNRRVVAILVFGQFPDRTGKPHHWDYQDEAVSEQLMVLPIGFIQHLTSTAGFININSDEMARFEFYDPSKYVSPNKDWLPPYPYCTDEVLFLAQPHARTEEAIEETTENAVNRFDNEGGRTPDMYPGGH